MFKLTFLLRVMCIQGRCIFGCRAFLKYLVRKLNAVNKTKRSKPSSMKKWSFSMRVVKYWNRLPAYIVMTLSVLAFKKPFDNQWGEILPKVPV